MKNYLRQVDQILKFEPDPAFARRARIIFENLDQKGNEKVLEVGCGRGFYLNALSRCFPKLKITGIDLSPERLDKARDFIGQSRVELLQADVTSLPFKNNSFDRIIAAEILEHVKDDQRAISEIYRVLRPGGLVMITVPNKDYPFLWDPLNWVLEKIFNWHIPSNIWWLAGIWADHVRLYDRDDLITKFKKVGFKIRKIWRATHFCFPFSHFLLYGLGKNLVEKGLLENFNRFRTDKPSFFNKIVLWPIRKVDEWNERVLGKSAEVFVNLILKVQK